MSTAPQQTSLAFERHGAGVPFVLLPGLTFDRSSWRPIVDRLGERVCTIAVDLPAHGDSAGPPCELGDVAVQVHRLIERLEVDDPIVVGHSMSGAIAMIYAAFYPVRGAVMVDSPVNLRPFGQTVRQLEPALRGPDFAGAFAVFERSMGLELVPEPLRTTAVAAHEPRQDVVLGYWDQLLRTDPDELQATIEDMARRINVPVLAVHGRPLSLDDRDYLRRLVPDVQVEEWPGLGHFVHLADADRFVARLRAFADFCERGRSKHVQHG